MLTTPEQLCLLISHPQAELLFGSLKRIVLDELHALVTSKRGELLSLALARIARLAPDLQITALSATEMACQSPAGVMEQEQAFLEALPLATGYAVEGTGLTLLTREGTIVATFTRAG